MTAAVQAYYPYFRSTRRISFLALGAAPSEESVDPELRAWETLVNQVELAGAVTQADANVFEVDHAILMQAVSDPIARGAILQSVKQANDLPSAKATSGPMTAAIATASSSQSVTDIINAIFGIGADVPSIQQNVSDIAHGTKLIAKHWWGVELAFTQSGAKALASLIGTNIGKVPALLTALGAIPALAVLAVVSGIVAAVAKGLAAWINAANSSGNGVLLHVYAWIFPFFTASPTPVTVP